MNYDYYVLELSSFQLDDIIDFAPKISLITNISPDHLDLYNYTFVFYIKSKQKFLRINQIRIFFYSIQKIRF